jgi:hypothetical protein
MSDSKKTDADMTNINCPPMGQCIPQETVIRNVRLAAAYIPWQKLCTLFSPIEALKLGTAFPELYSPYKGVDKKARPARPR